MSTRFPFYMGQEIRDIYGHYGIIRSQITDRNGDVHIIADMEHYHRFPGSNIGFFPENSYPWVEPDAVVREVCETREWFDPTVHNDDLPEKNHCWVFGGEVEPG